jgi:hypothetical protein
MDIRDQGFSMTPCILIGVKMQKFIIRLPPMTEGGVYWQMKVFNEGSFRVSPFLVIHDG